LVSPTTNRREDRLKMFIKIMRHQGADNGSRTTPVLIAVNNITKICESSHTITKMLAAKRWTEIHTATGHETVEYTVEDIEYALLHDENGIPRSRAINCNFVIDVAKCLANRRHS